MQRKLVTGTYTFCINSNYYVTLEQYVNGKSGEVEKVQNCDNLSSSMKFSKSLSSAEICKKFKFLYKSFGEHQGKNISDQGTLTDYDCNFLNYWLNDKLRENVNDDSINVKEFYERVKEKDSTFFSNPNDLEKHMHVIDPEILKNMKLLYKLYDSAVKIKSIIDNAVYINEEEKQKKQDACLEYTKECDENYKKAMDRCLNSNDGFYNALIYFKDSYKIITETSSNESNVCNSSEFDYFPEYDAVLEKKANAIKISSTLSILSLVLPLIYRYTPFGPLLRANINRVKNKWMNMDEYGSELSSLPTDVEDNISDNEEYNIGYSETN
ncbi:PIR Superfamily Protein [Plasmodium ovale curtisi]|uniref:PIR Superfamily Protein n=1 Tax=Plasmodium ovale curtisi TaxID=864141 RepID=A0A1A8XAY5_PLAOA|nr:PIR Superfamily Protein [Plasmodium ovale curtisi]